MCLHQTFYYREQPSGDVLRIPKGCGTCWQCKGAKLNTVVGKILAEASLSDWVCTLTLTYRPRSDGKDRLLFPPHFQAAMKRLRRRVAPCKIRYFVAGEYGELRGRAHFHVILFGKGKVPTVVDPKTKRPRRWRHKRRDWDNQFWPHGHIQADWVCDLRAARYVAKYVNKETDGDAEQCWISYSLKPCLGQGLFRELGRRDAADGVRPSTFHYRPPGSKPGQKYLMTATARREYLDAWQERYESEHGPLRPNDLADFPFMVLKTLRKSERVEAAHQYAKQHLADDYEAFAEYLDSKRPTALSLRRKAWADLWQWDVDGKMLYPAYDEIDQSLLSLLKYGLGDLEEDPDDWPEDSDKWLRSAKAAPAPALTAVGYNAQTRAIERRWPCRSIERPVERDRSRFLETQRETSARRNGCANNSLWRLMNGLDRPPVRRDRKTGRPTGEDYFLSELKSRWSVAQKAGARRDLLARAEEEIRARSSLGAKSLDVFAPL